MKFERLRLAGFKSFCDPQEFKIEPGLTGIVGPNGCGKSNLVEAMRWVMGESSYKNMRASGMDDVIFSGSGKRASRNIAEVGLVLDNADRRAPAAFNDHEVIEVTRRIERDSGSTYRVNGREARARDVQLLFADASTGARSPSMVRQGQIGEIISAKPQARRLILEEAAGVSGLHSRRHEAELRLKAAEDNLLRLDDVVGQVEAQVESLRKQAKQTERYRVLAADIRRHEALSKLIAWRVLEKAHAEAERRLEADVRSVAERTRAQAETARIAAIAAAALPPLRDAEARAGAAVHRLALARDALAGEEKRADARATELKRRVEQLGQDLKREDSLIADAAGVNARLEAEELALATHVEGAEDVREEVEARRSRAEHALSLAEAALSAAQADVSDVSARRNAMNASLAEEAQRLRRFELELAEMQIEREALTDDVDADAYEAAEAALEAISVTLEEAEADALEAEARHRRARDAEGRSRRPLDEAERSAQRLETEARTLQNLLGSAGRKWPPVVDAMRVERGFEAAIGAALGDDLDASIVAGAPSLWSALPDSNDDPALPEGVENLAQFVEAPAQLQRRLRQIGIVARERGPTLQRELKVGQRLVSREGDLWRWDGLCQTAEAPTPAARLLAERNRLGDLQLEAEAARETAEVAREAAARAAQALREAANAEGAARQRARAAQSARDWAREKLASAERRRAQTRGRLLALDEAQNRARASRDEASDRRRSAEEALSALGHTDRLAHALDRARANAARAGAEHAEARAAAQNFSRELQARAARLKTIGDERKSWRERLGRATDHIAEIAARRAEGEEELERLTEAPNAFLMQRRRLMSEFGEAEQDAKAAIDQRASAEAVLAQTDRAARAALEAMSSARELRAAAEERLEAARRRRAELLHVIEVEMETSPDALAPAAGLSPEEATPELAVVERRLDNLKQERERLGPVNLRADVELREIEASRDKMIAEREDLTEAIKRLRQAISSLNQEGRERLLAAFDVVNKHFGELFATLFEGGEARLQLIESDDPLEAGLELWARPPGKKPQTLTLLSGGEQALTAMSLIFAVFLTNPSPICVLDEVDAPLDDYNVERFCDLLEAMRKRADTRFITITHNPVTMARMDRLFGVTMAERGVSQIVSVDLATAERFSEAS